MLMHNPTYLYPVRAINSKNEPELPPSVYNPDRITNTSIVWLIMADMDTSYKTSGVKLIDAPFNNPTIKTKVINSIEGM